MLHQSPLRITQKGMSLLVIMLGIVIFSGCGSQTIDQRRPSSVGPSGPPTILPATEPPPIK